MSNKTPEKLSPEDLEAGINAALALVENSAEGPRILRDSLYFFLSEGTLTGFAPMRHVIKHLRETTFGQNGGKGENRKKLSPVLESLGWREIKEGAPEFMDLWARYDTLCQATGEPPEKITGQKPHTGRIFWIKE